jgi:predicted Zn-dependent protease
MKDTKSGFLLVAYVFTFGLCFSVLGQTSAAISAWTPPLPRTKTLTPFEPRPLNGDNIFRGPAEIWLADAASDLDAVDLTPIADQSVANYVSVVGNNLAKYSKDKKKEFKFIVVDEDYEDAFTAGAGRVYITLGLLKNLENEDELAAMLAHEMAHDIFHHCGKMLTRQLFWMTGKRKVSTAEDVKKALEELQNAYEKNLFAMYGERVLGFARFDELEADRAAFYNLYKAGYNPSALKRFFIRDDKKQKQESGNYKHDQFIAFVFGTHPPSKQRATAMSWESNFVDMPAKHSRHKSSAFDAMKSELTNL